MKVRAVRLGYYDLKRKLPGEEFFIKDELLEGKKLPSWVESVDDEHYDEAPQKPQKSGHRKPQAISKVAKTNFEGKPSDSDDDVI